MTEKCKNCAVELEKNMNFCPLCGEPVISSYLGNNEYITIRKQACEEKQFTDFQKLTPREKRKFFWEISGIIFLSGIVITLIIDLIANSRISWSRYPITICAVLFINVTLIFFLYHKYVLLLLGSFVSTSSLLILYDMFNNNLDWGIKLGIPLLLAAYLIIFFFIIVTRQVKKPGLNIVAYSLIASGLLAICTEGIILLHTINRLRFEWSIIVMASVLPVSVLLLFFHHRVIKGVNLKRFFHI